MAKQVVKPELATGIMGAAEVMAYRKYIGASMGAFGEMAGGITARTIGRYERGDTAVPTAIADAIRSLLYPRRGEGTAVTVRTDAPSAEDALARARSRVKELASKPPAKTKQGTTGPQRKLKFVIEVYEMEE